MKPKAGLSLVRIFGVLMMAFALIGVMVSAPQANAQTLSVCELLDANGDNMVDATEAGLLAVDVDGDGDVDVDDQNLVILNCTALLAPVVPPTGPLTVFICDLLDANGDNTVDATEAAALAVDLDGDGDIDADDQNIAIAGCDALLAPVVPPTGPLTAIICNLLDLNDDGVVDSTEAGSLATDLDGDGDIDAGDQNIAIANCGALLAPVVPAPTVPAPTVPAPGGPGAPTTGEPGSLVVSKFVCTQIEEPTATISDPVGTAGGDGGGVEEGCSPSTASFEIYLNNDFTSAPFAEFDAGVETINGIPTNVGGVPHLLLEIDSNVFFSFFVESGGVTTITVLNPVDDGNATPVADDGSDDGGSSGGGNGGGGRTGGGRTSGGGSVSTLPSTGQGVDNGTSGSAIVLLFGAMSLVALTAGFAWRQRRAI